jgi:hypothetical protein
LNIHGVVGWTRYRFHGLETKLEERASAVPVEVDEGVGLLNDVA